jgi:hypothetical protein
VLARAHVGELRAGIQPDAVVLLHHHTAHRAQAQLDGEGEADRPGASNHDIGVEGIAHDPVIQ